MSAVGIRHFHVVQPNTVYSYVLLAPHYTTSFSLVFPQSNVPVPIPLLFIAPYFSQYSYMWSHSHTSYPIPPPQLVMSTKFAYNPTIAVLTPGCSTYCNVQQTRMLLLQGVFKNLAWNGEEWALYVLLLQGVFKNLAWNGEEWVLYVRNFSLAVEEWELYFNILSLTADGWALYFKNLGITVEEWALHVKNLSHTAEEWELHFKNLNLTSEEEKLCFILLMRKLTYHLSLHISLEKLARF